MRDRKVACPNENSILFTVVFLENGALLKKSTRDIYRSEMELLVPKEVALDSFLRSLEQGLSEVLLREHNVTGPEASELIYQKTAWKEIVHAPLRMRGEHPGKARLRDQRGDTFRKTIERRREARASLEGVARDVSSEGLLRFDRILCRQVIHDCVAAYIDPPEAEKPRQLRDIAKSLFHRYPTITLYSHRILPEDDTSHHGLILTQKLHGTISLDDLGFSNGCILVFDTMSVRDSYLAARIPQSLLFPDAMTDDHAEATLFEGMKNGQRRKNVFHIDAPPKDEGFTVSAILTILLVVFGVIGLAFAYDTLLPECLHIFGLSIQSYTLVGMLLMIPLLILLRLPYQKKKKRSYSLQSYELYIQRLVHRLRKEEKCLSELLQKEHPSPYALGRHNVGEYELYSSLSPRYFFVRLGTTTETSAFQPSSFEISNDNFKDSYSSIYFENLSKSGPGTFHLFEMSTRERRSLMQNSDIGCITELPDAIRDKFTYVSQAPVFWKMESGEGLGLLLENEKVSYESVLDGLILDLCIHHSPNDLQILFFGEEYNTASAMADRIRHYKHLPHFHGLFRDRSQFAFSKLEGRNNLNKLFTILNDTEEKAQSSKPRILLVMEKDYGFLDHYLYVQKKAFGLAYILCGRTENDLRESCSKILLQKKSGAVHYFDVLDSGDICIATPINTLCLDGLAAFRQKKETRLQNCFHTASELHGYSRTPNDPFEWDLLDLFRAFSYYLDDHLYPLARKLLSKSQSKLELSQGCEQYREENHRIRRIESMDHLRLPLGFVGDRCCILNFNPFVDGEHLIVSGSQKGRENLYRTISIGLSVHYPPNHTYKRIMLNRCAEQTNDPIRAVEDTLRDMSRILVYRKSLFLQAGVKSIEEYNQQCKHLLQYETSYIGNSNARVLSECQHLPHIFLFADLGENRIPMFLSENGEGQATSLVQFLYQLQKYGKGLGFHLIIGVSSMLDDEVRVLAETTPVQLFIESIEESADRCYYGATLFTQGQGRVHNVIIADTNNSRRLPVSDACPITVISPEGNTWLLTKGELEGIDPSEVVFDVPEDEWFDDLDRSVMEGAIGSTYGQEDDNDPSAAGHVINGHSVNSGGGGDGRPGYSFGKGAGRENRFGGDERPSERAHGDERPSERAHGDERPSERAHGDERPSERAHGDERPSERAHGDERPSERAHGDERPSERAHGDERPDIIKK